MLTEKSGFVCLVMVSSHRAGHHLTTISKQMDKAPFVCTGHWGYWFNKNQTRAVHSVYRMKMGLEGACQQIFIADMALHLTALAFAIVIINALMAAIIAMVLPFQPWIISDVKKIHPKSIHTYY